jgi:hypothetical protein
MKMTGILLMALLITLSSAINAAQTASATLFCWSLRFQTGTASGGATLSLSSIAGPPNGELYPDGADYASGMILDVFGSPITGTMSVALPPFADANGNGFNDFFEVSQAVGLSTTAGAYTTFLSDGTITARWSRGAGSKNGTCVLSLDDDDFGPLGDFAHTFEVLEYTGSLTYTPGSNAVSSSLNLTNAADQLRGPVNFVKSVADPHNQMTLQSAFLTNAAQQTLTLFTSTTFLRDTILLTNYYGGVEFNDGDLNTAAEDYYSWELSIDDPNDSDHDGIPNFSDEPQTASPRRPVLSLTGTSTNLLLTISGDVGRLHHILESTNLATGNWKTNLSLTLTNDPQTISLPLTSVPIKLWRVLVP